MKANNGFRITVIILLWTMLMAVLAGCSVTVGNKELSVSRNKPKAAPSVSPLSRESLVQTSVAATLVAQKAVNTAATPTSTPGQVPTLSEDDKVKTAVAATLTQVAAAPGASGAVGETPEPTPQATATPTASPTATKAPPAASTPIPKPGFVLDFENFGAWKRGVQPYGDLKATSDKKHEGEKSAELNYDFPQVDDDFVVFLKKPPAPIPGEPTELTIWVYGDGSGYFLNVWVIDSKQEVRQFTFGRIQHADAWERMTAKLDTTAEWPQDHISGPDNGKLDYPIKLYALVLDAVSDHPTKGSIYLDELVAKE